MTDDDVVGYRFNDTGNFDVRIFPTGDENDHDGMVFINHPLGKHMSYSPKYPTDFWKQAPKDIRNSIIRAYVSSIDWPDSDPLVAMRIIDDANALGIDLGGDGDD